MISHRLFDQVHVEIVSMDLQRFAQTRELDDRRSTELRSEALPRLLPEHVEWQPFRHQVLAEINLGAVVVGVVVIVVVAMAADSIAC